MLSRLLKKNVDEVPAFTKRRLFTSEQKAFYGRLRRALPKCYIFPDIELAKLMVPTSTDSNGRRAEELLMGRTVDFAVFDARLNLLCAIELTPPDGATAAQRQNARYLDSAGIRLFRWDAEGLPSTDQMLRALAEFSSQEYSQHLAGPATQLADAGMQLGHAGASQYAAVSVAAPTEIVFEPRARYLAQEGLERLTPQCALKKSYPHVWNRITLFLKEPRHLEQYINSLSVQDRGGVKRAGFSPEALSELSRILGANATFMQPAPSTMRASWNDVFVNR